MLTADAYKDRKLTLSSVRRCLENKMEKVLAQQGMLMLFVYFCCVFVHTAGAVDVILQLLLFAVNAPQQCELASLMASATFRDFPNNRHLFHIFETFRTIDLRFIFVTPVRGQEMSGHLGKLRNRRKCVR